MTIPPATVPCPNGCGQIEVGLAYRNHLAWHLKNDRPRPRAPTIVDDPEWTSGRLHTESAYSKRTWKERMRWRGYAATDWERETAPALDVWANEGGR